MLSDQIRSDLNAAMKAGEALRVSVLRMALSAFNYKKIEVQRDLSEADEAAVVQNEAKKRREAIESYRAGGRAELEEQEREELEMLQAYLPKQMNEIEIEREIGKLDLPKDFAAAMKIAVPMFKGRADGRVVADIVRRVIQ
ncbi:GatB/YqeY domain-containing protein [Candidatus Amesbacteria bacterium]|nr:GatB/YqeY domain-containing protein [Candidatus Amesbacteria bacterium]MBI2587425.1 GatB/YqeY domain-containing protein [Candidatus Amesbacteria bacterium]